MQPSQATCITAYTSYLHVILLQNKSRGLVLSIKLWSYLKLQHLFWNISFLVMILKLAVIFSVAAAVTATTSVTLGETVCNPGEHISPVHNDTCIKCDPGTFSAGGSVAECTPCKSGYVPTIALVSASNSTYILSFISYNLGAVSLTFLT